MNTLGDRIKKYRNFKNMTQQRVAELLGESSGSVIYNWEKGIGRPDCDKIVRLCELLDVSADELLGCKSMMQRPTSKEWSTLKKYRVLDKHGKEIVDYLIDSEYERMMISEKNSKVRMLKIDWYTLPASAGSGNILDSDLVEELIVPESIEAELADFVVSVGGNSMEPTYRDKDKVFVEKCDSIGIGEIGIFVVNGDVYIKELGVKCLVSHNEKYKPIFFGENDSIYCCGKVIGIVND